MKIAVIVLVVAVVTAILFVAESRAQASVASKSDVPTKGSDPKDVYLGLRKTMLEGSRAKLGLPPISKPTEPWGVLMDWGVQRGTATVVAMSDGSASVYFSNGGGYIGGIGQEPIRRAAQNAVATAQSVQLPEQPTTTYPQPETHGVFFYLLTDSGVFMFRTSERELNSPNHPLRKIGDAMQGVITQYRLWDGRKKEGAQ